MPAISCIIGEIYCRPERSRVRSFEVLLSPLVPNILGKISRGTVRLWVLGDQGTWSTLDREMQNPCHEQNES